MPASRQACPVGLWLATSTSICRRIATICSALCFFLAMLQPPLVPVSLTFPLVHNSRVRSLYLRPRMALASGTRLGPYEIESPLGAGGMGEVYRARDTRLDRSVAIKILPADRS